MHIHVLLERADSKIGPIINAAMKAERDLSPNARRALERWLSYNWTDGDLSKDFQAGGEGTFKELYQAGEPIRQAIQHLYGDSVLLYRGMKNKTPREGYDMSDKRLYSWTFDETVADGYAFPNRKWVHKPLTPSEIDRLVARYNAVGYVTYSGRHYKRNSRDPDTYDIYDRNRQHVTDGDDLRGDIEELESMKDEMMSDNLGAGKVAAKLIPVRDIVWFAATIEKEVIVMGHSS